MVLLVGIGKFSVGKLADCRCPFTESTLNALDLRNSKWIPLHPTHNTKSQQPGDCDQLETVRDETRSRRQSILARFRRSRVCGNRPRIALTISQNDECYTYIDRHTRQTDRQTDRRTD